MTDELRVSCPVSPLAAFEPRPMKDLRDLIGGLTTGLYGRFKTGTVTRDGRLDMCKQAAGSAGARLVLQALVRRSDIHTLLFGTDGLGDEGAAAVAEFLADNERVETVYLGCNGITAMGVRELGDGLVGHPGLRGLWLKRNPVRTEGARHLADALAGGSRIEVLDLVHTGIGVDGLAAISDGIVVGEVPLSHLFVGGNALSEAAVPVLIDLIRRCPSLRHVSMQANFIGTSGVMRLSRATVIQQLRSVGLGSNGVSGDALAALALALHPDIEAFDVGMAASERALRADPNVIHDEDALTLVHALRERERLHLLDLAGCSLSRQSCARVIELVLRHPSIEELRIHGNELTSHHRQVLRAWRGRHHAHRVHPLIASIKSAYR